MITKYILNPEEKKECDALPEEKKKEILAQIEELEKNYHKQLERLRIIKMYFTDEPESTKDVSGRVVSKRYKYNTQWN